MVLQQIENNFGFFLKNIMLLQYAYKRPNLGLTLPMLVLTLNSVKGRMTFTFEIKSLLTFHKEFIHHLGLNMVKPGGKEDFIIICEDQKIKFEKQLLINVSTVFREMLENQWTKESKDGQVEIKEVKPETILAFKQRSTA